MTAEQKGRPQPQIGLGLTPPPWMRAVVRRRSALSHGIAGAGGAALGAAVHFGYDQYEHNKLEVTDEPLDVQIRKLEQRAGQEGLRDEKLRLHYTWLLAQWYGERFAMGAFYDEKNPYAAAEAIYAAISLIASEVDPRLQGFEGAAGWTVAGESITMNLTAAQVQESYFTNKTGASITPLMSYRDTLVHEMTHFIVEPREVALSIDQIKRSNPEFRDMKAAKLTGFRIYFDPDPDNPELPIVQYMDDFDEACTEYIANYAQRISGFTTGLPTYPEGDVDEHNQSRIERIMDTLEGTIKLAGITPEDFMIYHKLSDLDGLSKRLAEATTGRFLTDAAKVVYGLRIIDAVRTVDRAVLGEFVKQIKS